MSAPGVRGIIDLSLHPMFVGTNFVKEDGRVEANCTGSSTLSGSPTQDCEIAQYFLCSEYGIDLPEYDYRWWDFVACMYRNQSTLSASDAADAPFQGVVSSCSATAGFEASKNKELHQCYANDGGALLQKDHEKVTQYYEDAVWITVNGVLESDSDAWLTAICDAYEGVPPEGCETTAALSSVASKH